MKKLFVISGSSGVGKGTIIKKFLERNPHFKLSISCTTRKMRAGEQNGINYYFLTKEEFMKSVKNDDFLEWAEFSGNYYGTNKKFVKKCLDNDENILLEIDTQGALQVKEKMDNAILIFITPPSLEELERRLRGRGTENEETIQKRLSIVKSEMNNSKIFDYTVVNDEVDNAVNEIERIIQNEQV